MASSSKLWMISKNLRLGKVLYTVLKAYGYFAVCNVGFKFFFALYCYVRSRRAWKNVPGEPISFTKLPRNAARMHDFYTDMLLKHPKAPLIKTCFPKPELVCNTPESIKWMLKDEFDVVTKPSGSEDFLLQLLAEFIGENGIFVTRHGSEVPQEEQNQWYKQRKLASLIFTKKNFNSLMYDTFVQKAKILCDVLDQAAEKEEKIDMQEKFFSFTMDSIEKIFFGEEVNSVAGQMSEYGCAFDDAHRSMFLLLVKVMVKLVLFSRILLPYPFGKLSNNSNPYTLSVNTARVLSKYNTDFVDAIKRLDNHVYDLIKRTRQDPNLAKRKDLMALFTNTKINNEGGLDDKTLRDVILNLTIAGRDTTACTLTWMFYILSTHPEVQEKLCEEIDRCLEGRTPTPEDITPEKMPYLNGVLYETLRLYPPVPQDIKKAKKDIFYLDGTLVPEGTRLTFHPYSLGRNPELYSDPLKVDPNRWIPFKQPSLYEFPVFQAGPRFCLGKDMAQFESKLLASILLQRFTFSLLEGEAENITYSLMVTMSLCNKKDGPIEDRSHYLW
eukprot:CAMPEP_0184022972 /NCGR_PEP_ID=MMETSP0954-20121128/11011_1 /TAXON_ID=627963 /ORGANISM="Aplanochytrium sp, Strain PBS07" /LENGTH=553 /DNA_ID=CAMNT_0026305623 /DNA_START=104 /DNA_END=1762 /DNA_ORIENTATION=+